MNVDRDLFNAIKTGNNIRVILRNPIERRNAPTVGNTIRLIKEEEWTSGIIINAVLNGDVLDLNIVPYIRKERDVSDGHIMIIVTYRCFNKSERLEQICSHEFV